MTKPVSRRQIKQAPLAVTKLESIQAYKTLEMHFSRLGIKDKDVSEAIYWAKRRGKK